MPGARGRRLARRAPGRPVRRARRASAPTAASSPSRRSRRAPGACSSRRSTRTRVAGVGAARAVRVLAVDGSARGARPARARVGRPAAGERLHGGRHHRLDRQDLDQGHPGRAARAARSAGACTPARANYNTEIGLPLAVLEADGGHARRWCSRWRCAGRARSASWREIAPPRGRRDHERRPGAPRAARHGRGASPRRRPS